MRSHLMARFGVESVHELQPRLTELWSENRWMRADRGGWPVLFVKVYARPDRGVIEQRASEALPDGLSTRMVGHGHVDGAGQYSAFAWDDDLTDVTTDNAFSAGAGYLLARLHSTRPPTSGLLPADPVTEESYTAAMETLARTFPEVYERVAGDLSGRRARSVVREAESVARDTPDVFLHGDLARRNIARRNATYLLLDLERAGVGPAELDLARIWGRELSILKDRHRFLACYRHHRGLPPSWPNRSLLRFARLRCAVTTLITACRRGDSAFASEGHQMLRDVLR
ncbi:phosphotransferase family protein [Streptomyces sp. NPDC057433]|uniref:phosphotransferase family protein n=1 Tax=Streptomyces sp. NPDC057433 TaxID=3346132 RepID=UPI0036AEE8E6